MSLGLSDNYSISSSFREILDLEAVWEDEIIVEALGEVWSGAEVAYVGTTASLGGGHLAGCGCYDSVRDFSGVGRRRIVLFRRM